MADVWPCQACTFLNHTLMKCCEVCETPRGKDGSASPFYPAPAAAPRVWSSPSPSSPSFLSPPSSPSSSSSFSSASSSSSHFPGGGDHPAPLDEVSQRLHICRKRDYRFLSLEALALTALPATLAQSLAPPPDDVVATTTTSEPVDTTNEPVDTTNEPVDTTHTTAHTDAALEEKADDATLSCSVVLRPGSLAVVLDGARLATQLTTLFLNDNALTSFPVALARLGQLRELHMHYNHLTTLPPEIGDFAHLEKLFLSHNALVSLPPEIGRLTSLQTLSLFNNKLTSVPPELGQLRSLHSLFLNDNALTSLPPQTFDALAGTLTVLQLNANRLSSLPAQIGRLSGLRKLNIEANALVTVPASLALLTDLSVLAFRRNLFHYAVGGTWNVSPPTLLHLACAAVRCHIRALSLPSSSSSSSLSLSPAVEEVLSSASPLSTSTPPSPPEATSPITAIYDRPRIVDKNDKNADHHDGEAAHDGVMSTLAMVQGLNITEELKKLLLEGESACSVCGKLLYGDGHVVRVFPMELTPSVSGGGLSLSLTAPADTGTATAPAGTATATTGQTGTAALAAPPTPAAGGGGGGGLLTAIPPHRPKVVVRGTYCSWLCAKRQVPLAGGYGGRPDRACAAPPPPALVTQRPWLRETTATAALWRG